MQERQASSDGLPWWRSYLRELISGGIGIAASFLVWVGVTILEYKPLQTNADAAIVAQFVKRMEAQDRRIAGLEEQLDKQAEAHRLAQEQSRREKEELRRENDEIKAELLRIKFESKMSGFIGPNAVDPIAYMCAILDVLPGENWAKLVTHDDDGNIRFVVTCMNVAYKSRFGVNAHQYTGDDDFSYWPLEIAQKFYENDLFIYKTRQTLLVWETWNELDGSETTAKVYKFYFRFDGFDDASTGEWIIGHIPPAD